MNKTFIYADYLQNIGQLSSQVQRAHKNNNGQPVVVVNLGKREYTLKDLFTLNSALYFWKKDNISVYFGTAVIGQPVNVNFKLTEKTSKYILRNLFKKVQPDVVYNDKGFYDLRGLTGATLRSKLISLSDMFNPTRHTMDIDVFGGDRRKMRDAYGLELSYTVSEYDKINVLVDNKTPYTLLRGFMSKMTFYKIIKDKWVVVSLLAIVKYYREMEIKHIEYSFADIILEMSKIPVSEVFDIARICDVDYDGFRSTPEFIVYMHHVINHFAQYVTSIVGTHALIEFAEKYEMETLRTAINRGIDSGKLMDPESQVNTLFGKEEYLCNYISSDPRTQNNIENGINMTSGDDEGSFDYSSDDLEEYDY